MNRAESALQFISPIERDTWVRSAMALRSEFGDAARDMWLDWSRQADSFRELDARAVWKSCRGQGVTIGSLYHEARQNGWRDEGFQQPTAQQMADRQREARDRASAEGQERIRMAQAAARKADWILSQCVSERHAYLDSKGFTEAEGLVWRPEQESNLLCIPMRVSGKLSGLQMIDKTSQKKFLAGQVTSGAEFCFDCRAVAASDWWVEGFATGLSLRACLSAIKQPYRIHVCFSANNLQRMARSGFVVADNDASGTGEAAAKATGLPYWMAPSVGQDLNDFHKAHGLFRASQALGRWLRETKGRAHG